MDSKYYTSLCFLILKTLNLTFFACWTLYKETVHLKGPLQTESWKGYQDIALSIQKDGIWLGNISGPLVWWGCWCCCLNHHNFGTDFEDFMWFVLRRFWTCDLTETMETASEDTRGSLTGLQHSWPLVYISLAAAYSDLRDVWFPASYKPQSLTWGPQWHSQGHPWL